MLLAHLRAATFEMPFEPGEVFGPGPGGRPPGVPRGGGPRPPGRRWPLVLGSENFPASEISLRAAAPENVVIIDTTPNRPRVLGEVDLFSAQVLVHERAIYIHESLQYYVDRLDWGEKKAYVHRVDVDHYTYANRAVTLKPLDVFAEAPATGGRRIHGEVMVASLVTLFKKLKFVTDENVGWGPIDLPELELQTTAYWLTAEDAAAGWRRADLDVALLGAGRAIQTVAAVLLMVDPRDLGLVTQVRSPHQEAPTDLPLRGDAGWRRALRAAVAAPRRAGRRRGGADRRLRVRGGLPGLHGPAPRTRIRRQGPRAAAARRTRRADRRRGGLIRGGGGTARAPARELPADAGRDRPRSIRRRSRPSTDGGTGERLAADLDGEVVATDVGRRRVEATSRPSPSIASPRPAARPAAVEVPLVCLDTETTGLVPPQARSRS